jgi:hypothetical protein
MQWLADWFQQASVIAGDPTRRAIDDVCRQCGDNGDELRREAQAKNWHVIKTEAHHVVIPAGKAESA